MLKVLVAEENLDSNLSCCRYLANDKSLDIVSSHTGTNTINTYYKIKPNILVINSNFRDKSYTDIVNELSSTSEGRNNCNIILTLEPNAQPKFNSMSKVYQILYLPLENRDNNIKKTIKQFRLDHCIFYELNEDTLSALFYKLKIYNEREGSDYLKYAIKKCYDNPKLQNNLNDIYALLSKELDVSYSSVRPAMRTALKSVNNFRECSENKGLLKLFENEDSITPKNFIRIISSEFLKYKK